MESTRYMSDSPHFPDVLRLTHKKRHPFLCLAESPLFFPPPPPPVFGGKRALLLDSPLIFQLALRRHPKSATPFVSAEPPFGSRWPLFGQCQANTAVRKGEYCVRRSLAHILSCKMYSTNGRPRKPIPS